MRKELHAVVGAFDGRFIGTVAALFFAVFLLGGTVLVLLIGLVVAVAGASVLPRGVRRASRRDVRDRLGF